MYFKNRQQAGQMLAAQLVPKYQRENCTVMALSNGGVLVGVEIAKQLHCGMVMLLSVPITLPRELDPLAMMDQEGGYTPNDMISTGEMEEYTSEYHNYIEQQKIEKFHEVNHIVGSEGVISKDMLRRHNVILVSDGFPNGFALEVAAQFLKPIKMKSLVVATPLASVKAIDRMHTVADDIYCLSVPDNYISTEHYYEENDVPDHETAMKVIQNISALWQ